MSRLILFLLGATAALFAAPETLYLQPNTTQIFTEFYASYGLLEPPRRTFFEDALYLDQLAPPSTTELQPSNAAIFAEAEATLAAFHRKQGDLELYVDPKKPKPYFYTASGSKHLIVALVYAIVKSEPNKKFVFAEEVPFYSGHPSAVTGIYAYPNARFLAFKDPKEIKLEPGEVLVEIVTSPNNPDGRFRKPLTQASILIADFVFASSAFGDGTGYLDKNLAWVREARKEGKHLFSFNSASKQFGRTGNRVGYIWYPLDDPYAASIFKNFFGFISASTVAGGSTGLAQFLDLIKMLQELPDGGAKMRSDVYRSLVMRHEKIAQALLKRYPGSEISSIAGSPTLFAKIKDARIPGMKAWEVLKADLAFVVNDGEAMGETHDYVRLNLSGYGSVLAELLSRLEQNGKYTAADLRILSKPDCSIKRIKADGTAEARYFVKPGDCLVEVDASQGPIEIHFPPFTGYEEMEGIVIRKSDPSPNRVILKYENSDFALEKINDSAQMNWVETLYLKRRWEKK